MTKAELPQEKLLFYGPKQLTDAELLALFLRTGIKGKSVFDIAEEALTRFQGWQGLVGASRAQFCSISGLGTVKYVQLQAAIEIAQRHLFTRTMRGKMLSNPNDTRHFLKAKLCHYSHEVFACIYLDSRHQIIHFAELFHGTLNRAQVHPREVVKSALTQNAAAIIVAHNHPSGNTEPSQEDIHITQQLKAALALVDILILDHFIVGDDIVSLAERGLI